MQLSSCINSLQIHTSCVHCSKCCPLQGSHPSSRHSTSSALSLEDVQQWKVGRESCACTGDLSSQLEYLFVNECPPSSWLPCRGVFLFFPRGSCYLPNFPAGLLHCTKGRTCLSLYSESTAQQGIRAHNPAGIAALARTTGPCSLILFLVLSAGMWFVREKASAWLIEEALSKAFTQSLPHPSTPAQPWCWGQALCGIGNRRIPWGWGDRAEEQHPEELAQSPGTQGCQQVPVC